MRSRIARTPRPPAPVPPSPFPVPVHFMFRGRKSAWLDLFDGSPLPDPDAIPHRLIEVEQCSVAQTFLRLRQAVPAVPLSDWVRHRGPTVASYSSLAPN